jgi:isopentenyldiphosphate isomerase
MMESEFQMSMIEELTFFLGIQVKQTKQGAFMHQAKYTKELMKKFNMTELKPVTTSVSTAMSVGPDEDGETVDQREYKSMIDSLLYLTATRPNIQFTVGCVHAFRLPHALHVG